MEPGEQHISCAVKERVRKCDGIDAVGEGDCPILAWTGLFWIGADRTATVLDEDWGEDR